MLKALLELVQTVFMKIDFVLNTHALCPKLHDIVFDGQTLMLPSIIAISFHLSR